MKDQNKTKKQLIQELEALRRKETNSKRSDEDLSIGVNALLSSESKYRRLFEAAQDGILILDAKTGMVLDANPYIIELLGLSYDDILLKKIWDLGIRLDLIANHEKFIELQNKGFVRYHHLPMETSDGRMINVEFVSNVYLVNDRKVIQCNIRDMTDLQKAREQIDILSRFPSENPNPVLRIKKDGTIVFANKNSSPLLELWECKTGEYLSPVWNQFVLDAFDAGEQTNNEAVCGEKTFAVTYAPIPDTDYLNVYGLDITERKQTEEALQTTEEKFRSMVENVSIGVAMISPNMEILEMNRQMREWFPSIRPDTTSICHRSFNDPPNDEPCDYCPTIKTLQDGLVHTATTSTPSSEGVRNFRVVSSPVRDAQDHVISAIEMVEDITERLSLEAQVRQSQKLESIGTLASGIAHEINNPLMGIINYAQLIHDRITDEKLQQFASGIIKEGNRVDKIVKNLLSFARVDKQSHSPAHLEDIIDASLNLIGSLLRKDQITIELEIPDDLPQIRCRSQQIEQVIMNLLTNARDALNNRYQGYHENKIIRISARSLEMDGEQWVRTILEDHGMGIPPDIVLRIFDPFFTTKSNAIESGTQTIQTGTGLGLSVSHGIVKEHQGNLSVESEMGEYSRFIIDLRVNNGCSLDGANTGNRSQ